MADRHNGFNLTLSPIVKVILNSPLVFIVLSVAAIQI